VGYYKITWKKSALKELKSLDKSVIKTLLEKIEGLKIDPRPEGTKKLKGYALLYRIRYGNYRIIYRIEDRELIIEVIRVGHRKNIYQKQMN
jgi:mRNA interferase RelE/StbE